MSLNFLNSFMLLGLAGISLPVIAHLLSKRKYDIVNWGAMQFLELGKNARRRVRLEQLLLLMLRIGLILLIVFAMSRPWVQGGFLANFTSTQSRDVVFIIDGSLSMGWEEGDRNPHQRSVQWVRNFLKDLRGGDTVSLIDARDHTRLVIDPPTRDFDLLKKELDRLPAPSGSSNLAEAIRQAVRILSRTTNLSREIVVLTDGQAIGWKTSDLDLWLQYEELLKLPAIKPRTWVVNVGAEIQADNPQARMNFSVETIQISRELVAVDYPVRIKTKVRYHGGKEPINRKVHLEVDGQQLSGPSYVYQVQLQPEGEASIEFEYRFSEPGSHLLSVVLQADNLPGDDRADAAMVVSKALPVLLLDGDHHPLEPVKSESYFARSALSARSNKAPWIAATIEPWSPTKQFDAKELADYAVVILANLPLDQLPTPPAGDGKKTPMPAQIVQLTEYVRQGGSLIIAPGDRCRAIDYNKYLFDDGKGLCPAEFVEHVVTKRNEDKGDKNHEVQIANSSLDLPWMQRFQRENEGGLTVARFSDYWKLRPKKAKHIANAEKNANDKALPNNSDAVVAARYNSGDPFLVVKSFKRGRVAVLAAPLDADWSTLPGKQDYVSFLHELNFHLVSSRVSRNVETGTPLVLEIGKTWDLKKFAFFGPRAEPFAPSPGVDVSPTTRIVRLNDTSLPGIYRFRKTKALNKKSDPTEHFVVNFDRKESDLTPLTPEQKTTLTKDEKMTFVRTIEQLKQGMFVDNSRTEFWYILLFLFLLFLVGEVVMIRRMVRGGHVMTDVPEAVATTS